MPIPTSASDHPPIVLNERPAVVGCALFHSCSFCTAQSRVATAWAGRARRASAKTGAASAWAYQQECLHDMQANAR